MEIRRGVAGGRMPEDRGAGMEGVDGGGGSGLFTRRGSFGFIKGQEK
jgi:hypothetical protein